jgi:hypothetical protein
MYLSLLHGVFCYDVDALNDGNITYFYVSILLRFLYPQFSAVDDRNSIWPRVQMLPLPQSFIFKVKIFWQKNYMYISTIYVCSSSFASNQYFVCSMKQNRKFIFWKALFLALDFSFFTYNTR